MVIDPGWRGSGRIWKSAATKCNKMGISCSSVKGSKGKFSGVQGSWVELFLRL